MRLYIDPGTGSMLFAIVIGLIGVLIYFLKSLIVKLRFIISGGKKTQSDANTIPLVIFSDDKRYWPVFLPIVRELDARGFDVVYMTASGDDPALTCKDYPHLSAQFIGEGNRAFAKLNFLKATIVLSTTPGLDVYQWKRSKYVKYYVHTWHSTMISATLYETFGLDYYDAVLTSGIHQQDDIRALEKLRDLPAKELVRVGLPFMDDKAALLSQKPTTPSHERTIILAPSWGPNSILNRFGGRMIRNLLDTGYHIIVRPHPQSYTSEKDMLDALMAEFPESSQLEWNNEVDNFAVLSRSDLLISDFSGVLYEYAFIFDKPLICAFTNFDRSKYDAWWLDTPLWIEECIPQLGDILNEENIDNIKSMIDEAITNEQYAERRRKIREETWAFPGEGAKRVADYLIEKYKELTESADKVQDADADSKTSKDKKKKKEKEKTQGKDSVS